jgi:anti-sigma B factor antagonist
MTFDIKILDNGIKYVKLVGRLDRVGTNAIDNTFTFQVATTKAPVIIDLSEVEFLASIGIRLLLSNARALENRTGKLVLLQPTAAVKDVLSVAGVDQLLEVYDDLEAAQLALSGI